MFYFENTPDPQDVKMLAEAEGAKIENLQKLKSLKDMDGIDDADYEDALEKFKSEKHKHSAGLRVYGGMPVQTRQAIEDIPVRH